MVQRLITEGLLRSPEIIVALRKVPRELFVSDALHPYAYNDTPLPTDRGQTISAPHGEQSRAIYGGHNERSTGIEDRQQSARGRCRERLPRRYDRRAESRNQTGTGVKNMESKRSDAAQRRLRNAKIDNREIL